MLSDGAARVSHNSFLYALRFISSVTATASKARPSVLLALDRVAGIVAFFGSFLALNACSARVDGVLLGPHVGSFF